MSIHKPLFYIIVIISFIIFQNKLYAQKINEILKIDSILTLKSNKPFNGIVFISQNGVNRYTKILGYEDLNKKTPLKMNSQFVIGSISKQFTAVLTLAEFDKGKIELFTPIRKYLPELEQKWADTVTVHHLLTHMHGIVELDQPTEFQVGTQYSYSQIGYELLAKIIERTSGESFATLSSNLFKKCGMKNTFHPDIKNYNNLVKGYTENNRGDVEFDSLTFDNYVAAGSFISTSSDLDKWNNLFYNGKLLKKETMAMLLTKHKGAIRNHSIFGITAYGYGITIDKKDGIVQLGQTGYSPGFVSMNFYFPENKTSLIILENVVYDTNDIKKTFHYHTEILAILRDKLKNDKL